MYVLLQYPLLQYPEGPCVCLYPFAQARPQQKVTMLMRRICSDVMLGLGRLPVEGQAGAEMHEGWTEGRQVITHIQQN